MTELDVPIMINGSWTGTIGLGDREPNRIWDHEESTAIEHAASLFSSWWEKRDYALRLEEAVESRNRQIKLEQSVAAAAQLLSKSNQPGDLDRALRLSPRGRRNHQRVRRAQRRKPGGGTLLTCGRRRPIAQLRL